MLAALGMERTAVIGTDVLLQLVCESAMNASAYQQRVVVLEEMLTEARREIESWRRRYATERSSSEDNSDH